MHLVYDHPPPITSRRPNRRRVEHPEPHRLHEEAADLAKAGRVAEQSDNEEQLATIVTSMRLQVAAAMPGKQRPLILQALLQAITLWQRPSTDQVAAMLPNLSNERFQEILQSQSSLFDLVRLPAFAQPNARSAPGTHGFTGPQTPAHHGFPQSRHKALGRLRQRILELQSFDLEGIMKVRDTLNMTDLQRLAQVEHDLAEVLQALFAQQRLWSVNPNDADNVPLTQTCNRSTLLTTRMQQTLEQGQMPGGSDDVVTPLQKPRPRLQKKRPRLKLYL